MGERFCLPARLESEPDEVPQVTAEGAGFQLDPSSVTDAGSLDENNFIEVKLRDA
jgi:hypothetical protein